MTDWDSYVPSNTQQKQLDFLLQIVQKAREKNVSVLVVGGYGLDALYGKLTRDHNDFDMYIYEKDTKIFLEIIEDLGFYYTPEKVGTIAKTVYKHKELPESFGLEFSFLEKALELLKQTEMTLDISSFPMSDLGGEKIWTPSLEGFKIIIKINDSLGEKSDWGDYPHRDWQGKIIKALEEKFSGN